MSKEQRSNFSQLIDELETMNKALDVEDEGGDEQKKELSEEEKIAAAAEAGTSDEGGGDDLDEEELGKSLKVTLEDGTELEAVDGTELVKSLMTQIETTEGDMTKAVGLVIGNIKKVADTVNAQAETIEEQGVLIKSLQETVDRIAEKPAGRKTVLDVHEKRSGEELHKSQMIGEGEDGLGRGEFLAKALTAQKEGKVTGLEISKAESCLNSGLEVPEHIVKKVIG